jgi:hypothetical protein
MSKRNRNKKRVARPQETGPINVYSRALTDAEQREELDALTWEQPTFAVPVLDKLLEGTDREAAQIMTIYML